MLPIAAMDSSEKPSQPVGRTPGRKDVPKQAGILPTTIKAKSPNESIYNQGVDPDSHALHDGKMTEGSNTFSGKLANRVESTETNLYDSVKEPHNICLSLNDAETKMEETVTTSSRSGLNSIGCFASSDADDEKEDHIAVSDYEWTEDENIEFAPAGSAAVPGSSATASDEINRKENIAFINNDQDESSSSEDNLKDIKIVATRVGKNRSMELGSSDDDDDDDDEVTNDKSNEMKVVPTLDTGNITPKNYLSSVSTLQPKELLTENICEEKPRSFVTEEPVFTDGSAAPYVDFKINQESALPEVFNNSIYQNDSQNSSDANSERENDVPEEVGSKESPSPIRSLVLLKSKEDVTREILGNTNPKDSNLRDEPNDLHPFGSTEMLSTSRALSLPTRKFVFISDEKAIPKQLNQLQEQSLRQRQEFQTQIHNLERKIASITAQLASETIDTDIQLKTVQERTIYKPLEKSYQRTSLHRSRSCIGLGRWISLEKRMSVLNSQMTHSVFVGFPDAKRQTIDKLRDEVEEYAKVEFKVESVEADKREGVLVCKFEEMVGSMARRYQEERATRSASIQIVTENIKSCNYLDVTKYEQILENIRTLREQIATEKMARKARDDEILRLIAENKLNIGNTILEYFGENVI